MLGPRAADFQFVRETLTDRTSQYVAVSQDDVDLSGNGHPDLHRHGFLIVNSEVGARALGIIEAAWRLVCGNGLLIMSASRRLFYRVHRQTTDESLVGPGFFYPRPARTAVLTRTRWRTRSAQRRPSAALARILDLTDWRPQEEDGFVVLCLIP